MNLPHNIDKSAFRCKEYIGYCDGAQRIIKTLDGWETAGLVSSQGKAHYIKAPTLKLLSDKLYALKG
jgi:hypothetical protein